MIQFYRPSKEIFTWLPIPSPFRFYVNLMQNTVQLLKECVDLGETEFNKVRVPAF
jgi:hypothetical protein